jgi:hypothetical protein
MKHKAKFKLESLTLWGMKLTLLHVSLKATPTVISTRSQFVDSLADHQQISWYQRQRSIDQKLPAAV